MYAHLLLQKKQLQNCVFGLNLEFMRYQVFSVATCTTVGKTPILSIIKGLCFVGQSNKDLVSKCRCYGSHTDRVREKAFPHFQSVWW